MRHLTPTTIAVATTNPPRRGEFIEMRVGVGDLETQLLGEVLAISPPDAGETQGAAGFSARFITGGAAVNPDLQRMVDLVGNGGVVADRTPPREYERYPVRWPVDIRWSTGEERLVALDLSRMGLFAASHAPLAVNTPIAVSIPLDHGDPAHGAGRVARSLPAASSPSTAIHPGFGVELRLHGSDERRFEGFVSRVARRSSFHVVVATSTLRMAPAVDELSAIGYVAMGADSLETLVDKAFTRTHRPDVVVIDSEFEEKHPETVAALEDAIARRPTQVIRFDYAYPGAAQKHLDRRLLDA